MEPEKSTMDVVAPTRPALRSDHLDCDPPALCRLSAYVPVRLTHIGKRHARKILLHPTRTLFFHSATNATTNQTTYYLGDRAFDSIASMPEFEYDTRRRGP